jgi:hypothetical protein
MQRGLWVHASGESPPGETGSKLQLAQHHRATWRRASAAGMLREAMSQNSMAKAK